MSKEQEVEKTYNGNEETKDPVLLLTEHLRRMAGNHNKVTVGGQQIALFGEVKDVRIGVWAYFTVGRIGFRTTTTADKEALLRGETKINLTKLFELPAPAQTEVKPIETLKKPTEFIQRSRWSVLGTHVIASAH